MPNSKVPGPMRGSPDARRMRTNSPSSPHSITAQILAVAAVVGIVTLLATNAFNILGATLVLVSSFAYVWLKSRKDRSN